MDKKEKDYAKLTVDAVCSALAWTHAALAKYVGGSIGAIWRWQARRPLPLKFCVGFLILAGLAYFVFRFIPVRYGTWAGFSDANLRVLELSGKTAAGVRLSYTAAAASLICVIAAFAAFVRHKAVLWIIKAAFAAWALMWLYAMNWALSAPAALTSIDYKSFDKLARNALWTAAFGWGAVFAFAAALVLLGIVLYSTERYYLGLSEEGQKIGDKIVKSLATGGPDPRMRTSHYWATGLFLFALIFPFLIRGCGREAPYGLIQGSGQPEVQVVKVKKKKKKKEKRFVVNAWSPYIFERIKVDDVKTLDELMEETQDTYQAQAENARGGGKLGAGGGKTGGWPAGLKDAVVRFIRLEYSGGDWDQDMGKGADYNLLLRFNEITGFKIAAGTESRKVERLKMFPKNYAPPFVFLTGSRGMNFSDREIKILRWYLEEEGGMLFIDNGGGGFGGSVRSLLSRVLPGKPFVDIASDDPVFQAPYLFPDGAPPFWHHDGTRARGVKIDGRWAVFYHPGDINDAWKDGHSGTSKEIAEQAYRLGVNVMYYAFNSYYNRHSGNPDDADASGK